MAIGVVWAVAIGVVWALAIDVGSVGALGLLLAMVLAGRECERTAAACDEFWTERTRR